MIIFNPFVELNLFDSLGVFVAKGDVGTGTIIGSAVFNILFVIGICALFAGQVSCQTVR